MKDTQDYSVFNDISMEEIRETLIENDVISYVGDYLKSINVVNYEDIIPLYFSSVGAHVLNLLNTRFCADLDAEQWIRDNPRPSKLEFCPMYGKIPEGCARVGLETQSAGFLQQFGQTPDLRVHTAYIAPPGFSKNFFMDFFLNNDSGFLRFGIQGIPATKITTMTEANYIGSKDAKGRVMYGNAKLYCAGIIAMPEFYSVTLEGQMQHSLQMETMLLEALEHGEIFKGLAGQNIRYYTHHTLWAATQPGKRFDISSGMGRRLNFLQYMPTEKEQEEYKEAQEAGYGRKVDFGVVRNVRAYMYKVWNQRKIDRYVFTDKYLEERQKWMKLIIRHTDLRLFDNVAMGYNFITNFEESSGTLTVDLDDRLHKLIKRLLRDRKTVSSEGKTEMELMLGDIEDKVYSFYRLVRNVSDAQLLPYDLAIDRINMAIKENLIGSFNEIDAKSNRSIRYIYSLTVYKSINDAKMARDKRIT